MAEVERQLKRLAKQDQELTREHIDLRQWLEHDFDPPDVRVRNQNRFHQVRQQQDALRRQMNALEAERKNLRPEWKNALEAIGSVFAIILGLLFIFSGGAFLSGSIAFPA